MGKEHHYRVFVEWQGNRGTGTSGYRDYGRVHLVRAGGKLHEIAGSSDRTFHGNAERWNPEELLLAALSQCHMLSYLHVATNRGVVVTAYSDSPEGVMEQTVDGGGHFTLAVLKPTVTVSSSEMIEEALSAHREASQKCFIANSVNFEVRHEPDIVVG
ncbi:MAG: OsmC family protein [Cryobacterium sp.]|nr:OsmC family protein [Cryobacterium sp.]